MTAPATLTKHDNWQKNQYTVCQTMSGIYYIAVLQKSINYKCHAILIGKYCPEYVEQCMCQ